ncbi:MAG: hybrid sensor histidine kinase/response regulator [Polaromonas sp.]
MPSAPASPGATTILFVDDEPQACKWFARLFGDEFTIVTAGGVDQALQLLDQHTSEIAVLVTDFRMPGRNGLDLLRAAQAGHRHVVRLMATAYAEKDVALAAINQGRVQQILEKPFDDAQVREALREALDTYRQREREHSLVEGRAVAMRETLGFLAHEINTPLATVLGYVEALKERHQPPAAGAPSGLAMIAEKRPGDTLNMLDATERGTLYAMSLVATFVQSARDAYPGAVSAFLPASGLISALLNEYPFQGDERACVTSDLAADFLLPQHHDLLYLVLCTLTKNALFALREMPSPRLHIALAPGPAAPGPAAGEDARHEIRFIDNGPGIESAVLERLMREPVTTRTGGSGMGLLFCRRVVQSMEGSIAVHSEGRQGTTVTLTFKAGANPQRGKP